MLGHLFLTINNKYPIKKTIGRLLSNVDESLLPQCLQENVKYILKSENELTADEKNEIVLNLQNCYGLFPAGVSAICGELSIVLEFCVEFYIELTQLFV